MPTYGETPSTPHTTRHTSNTRICLHTSAEIHPYSIMRIRTRTMATDGRASAASEIEVGSIYPTTQKLRVAAAAKQADMCVACVATRCVGCEGWRGSPRTSAFLA